MRILPFKATLPQVDLITSIESFFGSAKEEYRAYKKAGFFETTDREVMYVYIIREQAYTYRGIITANDIIDLDEYNIIKHEKTIAAKEQRMLSLTIERRAQIKPVLLGYQRHPKIESFIDQVEKRPSDLQLTFNNGSIQHELWEVSSNQEIKKLQHLFKKIPRAYVADGHHRCATTYHLKQSGDSGAHDIKVENLLVYYLPLHDLRIKDFNRIVDISDTISPTRLMAALSRVCKIKPIDSKKKPKSKHEMTACIDGEWYRLRWKKKILKNYTDTVIFDTALLNKYVIKPLLKIKDVRFDHRISYQSGISSIEEKCKPTTDREHIIGFCLYPVNIDELVKVADLGEVLPPKSTWFEPRMKNGLISIEI